MLIWFSFLLALALLLLIARKNLWLALFTGALTLGIFNLSIRDLFLAITRTCLDPSILLLALAVSLIPIIGRSLQVTGLLADLVDNLQMKRRTFLGFAAAFMGLLPLPGGALLSAPMLIRAGDDIANQDYAAINVWFRHIFILIYPLGAILPCTKMAGLGLYSVLLYLVPCFLLFWFLGYFFLLRRIKGRMPNFHKPDLRKMLVPIFIILSAPILHIILTQIGLMDELALTIAIFTSLLLCFFRGRMKLSDFPAIISKMKPWKFFLIIMGIFLFLNVFSSSNVSAEIARAVFSRNFLIIFIAALLGLVTGRIQLPVSILIPIYLAKYDPATLTPLLFATMYGAVFVGYMLSPIHPCVMISIEFFDTSFKHFLQRLLLPGILSLTVIYLFALLIL